jgi:hypothetical protein
MKQPSDEDRVVAQPAPGAAPIIFEAIVKHQAVAAVYNRGAVTLTPHAIYTRHGELYVDAVTIERDGKPPKETKLGAFKLAGLAQLRLTPRRFEPSALFVGSDPKYDGVLLMAVEPGAA